NTEAYEVERHDRRQTAEHVAIKDRQHADRPACRSRDQSRYGDEERPGEDEDLGSDEDEDVVEERLGDQRPFLDDERQEEERLAEIDKRALDDARRPIGKQHA